MRLPRASDETMKRAAERDRARAESRQRLRRFMIERTDTTGASRPEAGATTTQRQEKKPMTLEQLKQEQPAAFEATAQEAIAEGAKQERERCEPILAFAREHQRNAKVREIVTEAIVTGATFEAVQPRLNAAINAATDEAVREGVDRVLTASGYGPEKKAAAPDEAVAAGVREVLALAAREGAL